MGFGGARRLFDIIREFQDRADNEETSTRPASLDDLLGIEAPHVAPPAVPSGPIEASPQPFSPETVEQVSSFLHDFLPTTIEPSAINVQGALFQSGALPEERQSASLQTLLTGDRGPLPGVGDTASGVFTQNLRDISAGQVDSLAEVFSLLQQERTLGTDLDKKLFVFPSNEEYRRIRGESVSAVNKLREIARDEGAFSEFLSDPSLSEAQTEEIRQQYLDVLVETNNAEMVDALTAEAILEQTGSSEALDKLLVERTPASTRKKVNVKYYAANVQRNEPDTPLNKQAVEWLINENLLDHYGGVSLSPKAPDTVKNRVIAAIVEGAKVTIGDATTAYNAFVNYAEDKGTPRDHMPEFREDENRKIWEGVPVLESIETAMGQAIDYGLSHPEGGIGELVHQISRVQPLTESVAGKVAISGFGRWWRKNVTGVEDPIFDNWDRIPDRAKPIVERNAAKIYFAFIGDDEQASAFMQALVEGPPPKDPFAKTLTGSEEYTDKEYEAWVQAQMMKEWGLMDHIISYGVTFGFDFTNLAFFAKPIVGLGSIRNALKAEAAVAEGQKLTLPQRIIRTLNEANILYMPGGNTLAMTISPEYRSIQNARKIYTASEATTAWTRAISSAVSIGTKGLLKFVPNVVKTTFTIQARQNQAIKMAIRATNELFAVTEVAQRNTVNSIKALTNLVSEIQTAWKADPENLTKMAALFEKYGIAPTEHRWMLMRIIGETGDDISLALKSATRGKKGKDFEYIKGILYDSVYNRGSKFIYESMWKGGVKSTGFRGIEQRVLNFQNAMRGIFARTFLSTLPFHYRNVFTDSFKMAVEGVGPFRNTASSVRRVKSLGIDFVISGAGPHESSEKLAQAVLRVTDFVDPSKVKSRNPIQFVRDTLLGNHGVSTELEQRTRIRIFDSTTQKWTQAADDLLIEDVGSEIFEVSTKLRGGVAQAELQGVLDDVVRILQSDPSPGAFEGIINGVKKGSIRTQVRLDRITGVAWPKHLPRELLRDIKNKIIKLSANKRGPYLQNKVDDFVESIVQESKKYSTSPASEQFIRETTEVFIREMDHWIGKGFKTEEALARALSVYTDRLRRSMANRGLIQAVRSENATFADELDDLITAIEKQTLRQDVNLVDTAGIVGEELYKDGLVARRLKLWEDAYNEINTTLRSRILGHEEDFTHLLRGYTGKELRTGAGFSGKLGYDELITSVDATASDAAVAAWYVRRLQNSGKLDDIIKVQKISSENKKAIIEWVESIRNRRATAYADSIGFAQNEADRLILNYSDTGDFDFLMKFFFPWQFWTTRQMPRYMDLLARKPYLAAFYAKITDDFDQNPSLARLRGKVPLPFIGPLGKFGTPYIDPFNLLIPTDFVRSFIFNSEVETTLGRSVTLAQISGMGLNPALDALFAASGKYGDDPYAKSISKPPIETLSELLLLRPFNFLGVVDRKQWRITPAVVGNIGLELYAMVNDPNQDWTAEQFFTAVRAYNTTFDMPQNITEEWRNPFVEDPMLREAFNNVLDRQGLTDVIRQTLGVTNAWVPPGYFEGLKIKEEIQPVLEEAYRQAALGNTEPIEEIFRDPNLVAAILPRPGKITEREATRTLARNEYWRQINLLDDVAERDQSSAAPFDIGFGAINVNLANEKRKVLNSVMEEFGVTEAELVNERILAADIASLTNYLIEGKITSAEAVDAFDLQTSRLFAKLTRTDPALFVDDRGVFDGLSFYEVTRALFNNIPKTFQEAVDMWKKRDATATEQVRDAWMELYIGPIFSEISRINKEVDKEFRAEEIYRVKNESALPGNAEIIQWIVNTYPNVDHAELTRVLKEELPDFDKYTILSVEEDINTLRETGQPFRAVSELIVDESNVAEFEQAHNEFLVWQFARDHDLSTRDLWTPLVEKYWGNGQENSDNIKKLADLDSRINNILRNAVGDSDIEAFDIEGLVNSNEELRELIEERNMLQEEIVNSDLRSNTRFNRTTTSFKGRGYVSEVPANEQPMTFSGSGVAIILINGDKKWFMEIEAAIQEGRTLKSTIASELYAVFQKHPLGFRDFNSWLLAALAKWKEMGRPTADFLPGFLGEKAKELSPGETTSIQEQVN